MVINGDYAIDIVVDGDKGLTILGNEVDISNLLHGDFNNEMAIEASLDILNNLH